MNIKPEQTSVCSGIHSLGPSNNYRCGPSVPSSSGGLSQGEKIGIGVGVGVGGFLLLLGALFILFRSRRRNSRSPRSVGAGDYPTAEHKAVERSPARYTKVPAASESADEPSDQSPQSQRPVSGPLAENWTPPSQTVENTEGRVELEEQQGMRHEMDARSLPPDMDDEDDGADTRSLEDIERSHRQSSR